MNDVGSGTIGAVLGAVVTAFIAAATGVFTQRSKSETDQSVAVLGEWSKLNKGLADRLAAVEKEFSEYRQQIAADMDKMRQDCRRENDEMRSRHRKEMRAMRELNEGLQRMIAQNSKSTAYLMGGMPEDGDDES
jgi:gas vesicle protein